jgi:hypothetical protein
MKNIFYISILAALIGCTPSVQERDFKKAKTDFTAGEGPDERDTNLRLRVREFGEAPPSLVWQADVATGEFLQQTENLSAIGKSIGNQSFTDKAVSWLEQFYQSEKVARVDFSETPFTGLVTTQTQLEVRPALEKVLVDIEAAKPVIQEHILALKVEPPTLNMSLEEMLNRAEEFGDKVVQDIPNMGLSPVIEEGLSVEMVNTMKPLFTDARSFLVRFVETKTLSQALTLLDEAILKFEIELPPELMKSMKQGKGLAKGLDRMEDEQGALTVLVDVWRMLTGPERTEIMKPGNEELYNFFRKQDDDELECLRTPGCLGGPIDGVVKKLFILPKIRKYGVSQLRREMNTKTRDYVISSIQAFAQDFIAKMPQTFVEKIATGIQTKAGKIANVRDNYEAYVKGVIGTWSKTIMPHSQGTIPGFEPLKVILQVEKNERLKISPHSAYSELTSDLVGPSLAAQVLFLENKSLELERGREFTLSALNKLVAITGYRKADGTLAPALLAPVDHKGKLLDIMAFDETKGPETSFRIPDSVQLSAHFHFEPEQKYAKNFSANSFATQIHGLNQFLRLTRDWENTQFDKYLGDIQVQDVTHDAEDPALKQGLFPKDKLFALNLGAAAILFQDLTKRATPVFLYTLEGPLMWADKYETSENNAVMAGIVDIQEGKRGLKVDATSLSQLILAASEFLEVTKDAEKTKSSILLERPENGGERPLDSLIQGQKDLKLLVIALSNLLSNKMITADKLVAPRFDYVKASGQTVGYKLKDQALAMRALLATYKLTGIDAYLWSAQEIYFAMNKKMFNLKHEFYFSQGSEQPEFTEVLEMLRSLMELRPYLPLSSVPQLDRVIKPWVDSLKVLP